MFQLNNEDIRKVSGQLDTLYTALKCFIYYTEIKNKLETTKQNIKCLEFIEFTLLYTLLINWNELFGLDKKNNHWKKITLEKPEFTNRLYQAGNYTYVSWSEYRSYINVLCNNFITFPDPYHHRDQSYDLHGVNVSLKVTHCWLQDLVKDSDIAMNEKIKKWPITNKNHIEELKLQIHAILDNV